MPSNNWHFYKKVGTPVGGGGYKDSTREAAAKEANQLHRENDGYDYAIRRDRGGTYELHRRKHMFKHYAPIAHTDPLGRN